MSEKIKQCTYYTSLNTQIPFLIGIGFVFLSALMFLSWFHFSMSGVFSLSFAWLITLALTGLYAKKDPLSGLVVGLFLAVLTIFVDLVFPASIGFMSLLTIFVLGMIGVGLIFFAEKQESRNLELILLYGILFAAPPHLAAHLLCRLGMKKSDSISCKNQ